MNLKEWIILLRLQLFDTTIAATVLLVLGENSLPSSYEEAANGKRTYQNRSCNITVFLISLPTKQQQI